jgi:glycosyltransferase involved in cell wall biosynthesis
MRIALIAPPWYPVPPPVYGGIELVVGLLAKEWERLGHRVTVVASGGSSTAGELLTPLAAAPGSALIGNGFLEAYHALMAYASVDEADVIHDHSGLIGRSRTRNGAYRCLRHSQPRSVRISTSGSRPQPRRRCSDHRRVASCGTGHSRGACGLRQSSASDFLTPGCTSCATRRPLG